MAGFENSIVFIQKAREVVYDYIQSDNKSRSGKEDPTLALNDIFVVWFAKVLQNWKALVATNEDDEYYELTYNGEKMEMYVDVYVKRDNIVLQDD